MTFITNMFFKFESNIFKKFYLHQFLLKQQFFDTVAFFIIHTKHHLKIIEGKISSLKTNLVIIVNKRSFIGLFSGKSSLDSNLIFFKSFSNSYFSPPLMVSIYFLVPSQTSLYFFKTFLFSST